MNKDQWVLCYRKGLAIRGSNTTNYAEIVFRIMKDNNDFDCKIRHPNVMRTSIQWSLHQHADFGDLLACTPVVVIIIDTCLNLARIICVNLCVFTDGNSVHLDDATLDVLHCHHLHSKKGKYQVCVNRYTNSLFCSGQFSFQSAAVEVLA